MGKAGRTRKKAGRTAAWNLPLGEGVGWRWAVCGDSGPKSHMSEVIGGGGPQSLSREEHSLKMS